MTKRLFLLCSVTILALAIAAPAEAQKFEITPFFGYQFGGELEELGDENTRRKIEQSPVWGLIFDVDVTHDLQVELYYSSQGTELNRGTEGALKVDVDTFQVGLIREYAKNAPVNPYIGLTLGASRFNVEGGTDTQFSGTIALGLKMLVSDHAGIRFDGRIIGSSTGSSPISCSNELCIGYPDTSVIWQYNVSAGLIIHF